MLNFDGVNAELTADQQAFIDTYKEQGTVYQTAVNYVNPQWMDVGTGSDRNVHGCNDPRRCVGQTLISAGLIWQTAAGDAAWK